MYQFKTGEIREVGIEITSCDNQVFTIDTADYRIVYQGTEINHGIPTVDGHKIALLFPANSEGRYQVELTYTIGPEKLKATLLVEVS